MALVTDGEGQSISQFTVRELLCSGILGQSQVIAGSGGLDRLIQSVTVLTAPEPEKWLSEGQVLLTHGYSLKDSPGEFANVIETLSNHGCAAMCITLGRFVSELPPEAVARADELSFPVLTITGQPKWTQMIDQINTCLRSEIAGPHSALLDVCLRKYPTMPFKAIFELAELVEEILGVMVDVFDRFKNPIRSSGHFHQVEDMHGPLEVIDSTEGVLGYLRIGESTKVAENTTSQSIRNLARNLVCNQLFLYKVRQERRLMRSRILEEQLSSGSFGLKPEVIGLPRGAKNIRAIVITSKESERSTSHGFADRDQLLEEFENIISGPSMCLQDRIVGFASITGIVDRLRECLSVQAGLGRHFACGVGLPKSIAELPVGVQEAFFAVSASQLLPDAYGPIVLYEDLGPEVLFLSGKTDETMRTLIEKTQSLEERDVETLRTLEAYLRADCSLRRAAKLLHIHENTLKYRLRKIRSLIPISTFEDKVKVYLALRWGAMKR